MSRSRMRPGKRTATQLSRTIPRLKLLTGCLGASLLLAAANGAPAATATATMMVSVTVASTCTVSANPLTFGTYQPGQGAMSASTTLAVLCTKRAPFVVSLNVGTGGATVTQRTMSMGVNRLEYKLYTTAVHRYRDGDRQLLKISCDPGRARVRRA